MLVMATKLATFPRSEEGEEDDDDNSSDSSNGCTPVDQILIWVACNIITKYNYTLAISTMCNGIRLKYFGPMSSLNDNYIKLCEQGRGLVLSQNHIEGMTENGTKPLVLDIIIHDPTDEDTD